MGWRRTRAVDQLTNCFLMACEIQCTVFLAPDRRRGDIAHPRKCNSTRAGVVLPVDWVGGGDRTVCVEGWIGEAKRLRAMAKSYVSWRGQDNDGCKQQCPVPLGGRASILIETSREAWRRANYQREGRCTRTPYWANDRRRRKEARKVKGQPRRGRAQRRVPDRRGGGFGQATSCGQGQGLLETRESQDRPPQSTLGKVRLARGPGTVCGGCTWRLVSCSC